MAPLARYFTPLELRAAQRKCRSQVVTQPKEKHKLLRVLFLPKTKLLLDGSHLCDCNGTPDRVKNGVISEVSVHHAGQGMVKQSSSRGSQETETVPAGRIRTRSSLKGISSVTYTLPHLPPLHSSPPPSNALCPSGGCSID